MTLFQNLQKPYQKWELAGIAAVLLAAVVSQRIEEQKLFWVPLILLPGTILLGAAAYFHWKLPKNQKTPVKVSFWRGPSHVYLTFFAALLMNVIAFLGELQGWNGVVDAISTVIAILFAFAIIGARFCGRWYYWTDQDKKQKRREYHRKRHGKK